MRRLVLAAFATFLGGCFDTGGGAAASPDEPLRANVYAAVSAYMGDVYYATAFAKFWSAINPEMTATEWLDRYTPAEMDSCSGPPTATDTVDALNVGSGVQLVATGFTIPASWSSASQAYAWEDMNGTSGIAYDTRYDVVLPGTPEIPGDTWGDALYIPPFVNVTQPAGWSSGTFSAGTGDLAFSWSGGEGEIFITFFSDAGAMVAACRVADDGSFVVPAATVALLPASGYAFVNSAARSYPPFRDGVGIVSGFAQNASLFTKP